MGDTLLEDIGEWVYAHPRLTMSLVVAALFLLLGFGLAMGDYMR